MAKGDEATRLYQVRKIINESVDLLGVNADLQLDAMQAFELIEYIDEHGILIYHDSKTKERTAVRMRTV